MMDVKEVSKEAFKLLSRGEVDKVTSLVSSHPEISKRTDKDGQTLLHLACQLGDFALVTFLLPTSTLDALDSLGNSPVLLAARNGFEEIVEVLLEKKCKVDAVSQDGWFVVHYVAKKEMKMALKKVLEGNKTEISRCTLFENQTCLHVAAGAGCVEALTLILTYKPDVNAIDKNGDTALNVAVNAGEIDAIKKLLENKVKVNIPNKAGNTALHVAYLVWKDKAEPFAKLLKSAGADEALKNKSGLCPKDFTSSEEKSESSVSTVRQRNVKEDDMSAWLKQYKLTSDSLSRFFNKHHIKTLTEVRALYDYEDSRFSEMGLSRADRRVLMDALEQDCIDHPELYESEAESEEESEVELSEDEKDSDTNSTSIKRKKDAFDSGMSKNGEFVCRLVALISLIGFFVALFMYLNSIETK